MLCIVAASHSFEYLYAKQSALMRIINGDLCCMRLLFCLKITDRVQFNPETCVKLFRRKRLSRVLEGCVDKHNSSASLNVFDCFFHCFT